MIATVLSSRLVNDLVLGATSGIVISLLALSLVIIWQSTQLLNFAQGTMSMFATYIGLTTIDRGVNQWVAMLLAILAGVAVGAVTERVLARPLYGQPELNAIVVMIGFSILLTTVMASIWSPDPKYYTAPVSTVFFQSGGMPTGLSPYGLFQLLVGVGVMVIVALVFRFTKLGLQLRASALAPEVARLLGVRVNRMLTIGWAFSIAVGVVAGIVTSFGDFGLSPSVLDSLFVLGFIAAAIGGLSSPTGALVAGLLIGEVTQLVSDYFNSGYALFSSVVILIVVLMWRPQGLFSKNTDRRI